MPEKGELTLDLELINGNTDISKPLATENN